MPPIAQIAALIIVGASLMACSGRANVTQSPSQGASSQPSQGSQSVAVTPQSFTFSPSRGDTFSVGLKSAGGGGYEWHLEDGYDTRTVRLKGKRAGEPPSNGLIGAFADEIFDFEGVAAGQTTLVFSQYRSWEGPSKANETRRYPVTVK